MRRPPRLDPEAAPDHPDALFSRWLGEAEAAEVPGSRSMTLSTVDVAGRPASRVLILKDLHDGRWSFSSDRTSPKGQDLERCPWAALNFHWPQVGRQVRVRGRVEDAGWEAAARDVLERSRESRLETWTGKQSRPLGSRRELDAALSQGLEHIDRWPEAVPEHWARYDLLADEVEFWEADPSRRHARLLYRLGPRGWEQTQLWP